MKPEEYRARRKKGCAPDITLREKIVELFYHRETGNEWKNNEISYVTGISISKIQREVAKMLKEGLIREEETDVNVVGVCPDCGGNLREAEDAEYKALSDEYDVKVKQLTDEYEVKLQIHVDYLNKKKKEIKK